MFQISRKSELRTRLQALVSAAIPDLSTSIVDEHNINMNSLEDSGKFLL